MMSKRIGSAISFPPVASPVQSVPFFFGDWRIDIQQSVRKIHLQAFALEVHLHAGRRLDEGNQQFFAARGLNHQHGGQILVHICDLAVRAPPGLHRSLAPHQVAYIDGIAIKRHALSR